MRNVFIQLVFAWLIGNGGVHAKNVSVLQNPGGEWRVAPMYNVLSTLPYRAHTLALSVGGRTDGLIRRHIVDFGRGLGLPTGVVERSTLSQDEPGACSEVVFSCCLGRVPSALTLTRDPTRLR